MSVDVGFRADYVRFNLAWDVGGIPGKRGVLPLLGHRNLVRHHALALPSFRSPGLAVCFEHGYGWMFARHIKRADDGCDFDFLETAFGAPASEPNIF